MTKSLQLIIQPTKYNVVYRRYSVNHLTWIPIKIPFLGRRKPVDIKALRKAVWALAPKQATYTEINKLHFRIWNTMVTKQHCILGEHDRGIWNHGFNLSSCFSIFLSPHLSSGSHFTSQQRIGVTQSWPRKHGRLKKKIHACALSTL